MKASQVLKQCWFHYIILHTRHLQPPYDVISPSSASKELKVLLESLRPAPAVGIKHLGLRCNDTLLQSVIWTIGKALAPRPSLPTISHMFGSSDSQAGVPACHLVPIHTGNCKARAVSLWSCVFLFSLLSRLPLPPFPAPLAPPAKEFSAIHHMQRKCYLAWQQWSH